MKVILINKCSDPQMWYANKVGTTVPYLGRDESGLWSRQPSGYLNIVHACDGQIIDLEAGRDSGS